ncbi:MAG: phosphoenolpyruvate synthase, partial [Spirochaetia bacterium]|nr:phosphoenolpyruvate synthase [Spirochaetia bacterium]
ENVVQGTVTPDQYVLFKPSLRNKKKALVSKKLGAKEMTMVYAPGLDLSGKATVNLPTSAEKQNAFTLRNEEAEQIGRWALILEKHYGKQMDFEWAKDGLTNEIFLVQARPETVFSQKKKTSVYRQFRLKEKGTILVQGTGLGKKIASGRARILHSPKDADKLQPGEVLVTEITTPDWDPIMKKAAAIVTDQGGRTSHAAIVARELGIAAVVGTGDATGKIADGEEVTISCAEGDTGFVYRGKLAWTVSETDLSGMTMPRTRPMFILGDPGQAFSLAGIPNEGVGLMRMEFVITSQIRIHPLALARFEKLPESPEKMEIRRLTADYPDKQKYFVDKLAEGVATIAAAFHPKDVIVRMSDFKSNEYASLIGGSGFEPKEENPMLGFRGASRYDHPLYRDGFRLECLAMKQVREEMGFENVKLMVPFCRTPEEGKKVIREMARHGLTRGKKALEIYVMVEIPANVLQAEAMAEIFDGFSIGSNDLTQLTLGLDRDSTLVAPLFDENNPAVKELIARAIQAAKRKKIKIGLCGQAPSDHPEFARFLVESDIDSISFSPDAILQGIQNILAAERSRHPLQKSRFKKGRKK